MGKIFCVVGKGGAGKDSTVSIVSQEIDIPMAVSFTTRPMRSGETQGKEYHFITKEEFFKIKAKDGIAEYTVYDVADNETWYYGLSKEELEKDKYMLAIVNPNGLQQLVDIYGDKVVSILVDCDGVERIERAIKRDRNINPRELCRRFLADEKDFENVVCDYTIDTTSREEIGVYEHALCIIGMIMAEMNDSKEDK